MNEKEEILFRTLKEFIHDSLDDVVCDYIIKHIIDLLCILTDMIVDNRRKISEDVIDEI